MQPPGTDRWSGNLKCAPPQPGYVTPQSEYVIFRKVILAKNIEFSHFSKFKKVILAKFKKVIRARQTKFSRFPDLCFGVVELLPKKHAQTSSAARVSGSLGSGAEGGEFRGLSPSSSQF